MNCVSLGGFWLLGTQMSRWYSVCLFLVFCLQSFASNMPSIELSGEYIIVHKSGRLPCRTNKFKVLLTEHGYDLRCASASEDLEDPAKCARAVYDGINTYVWGFGVLPVDSGKPFMTINPGNKCLWVGENELEPQMVWLAYCIMPPADPAAIGAGTKQCLCGDQADPYSMAAIWRIEPCEGSVFPKMVVASYEPEMARSLQKLLATREILVPHLLFRVLPDFGADVDRMDGWRAIQLRYEKLRELKPGDKRVTVECLKAFFTNGVEVPVEIRVTERISGGWEREAHVRAHYINMGGHREVKLGPLPENLLVLDFRYWKRRGDKVCSCAWYELKQGETLRSVFDEELMRQVDAFLKDTPKYYEPPIERKHWVLWAVLPVVTLPPAAYLVWTLLRRRAARTRV